MDDKTREELRKIQEEEFSAFGLGKNDEEVKKAYHELGIHFKYAQQEMGLDREEAIIFFATMVSNMGKNGGKE